MTLFPIGRTTITAIALGIVGALLGCGLVFLCDTWIERSTRGLLHDDVQFVPENKVAVVLGCSEVLANGRTNLYFRYRIDAAAELYHAGRCDYLLVSGDNGSKEYDEPSRMKQALVAKGIPEDRIYADYAGFRTLDSMVRAEKVFGQTKFTVVSQPFHNRRAVYIARQKGLEAVGYNARDVHLLAGFKTRLREKLARVKTVVDLHITRSKPRYLGPPVLIGSSGGASRKNLSSQPACG